MKKQVLRPLRALAAFILVCQACSTLSTPPPAHTPLPSPTRVPARPTVAPPSEPPTETPTETPGALQYFTEEFDGDIRYWSSSLSPDASQSDAPKPENGYLVFDIGKNLSVYALYDPYTYTDVRLDVRVDNRGTNNNNINLVCRLSDDGWYEVSISNSGLYWIFAVVPSKRQPYVQIANGGSNKIHSGKETNEYTLICKDRDIRLLINGVNTRTYTDNQFLFREGQIGIGLSSFEDSPTTVEFDWVKISQP